MGTQQIEVMDIALNAMRQEGINMLRIVKKKELIHFIHQQYGDDTASGCNITADGRLEYRMAKTKKDPHLLS